VDRDGGEITPVKGEPYSMVSKVAANVDFVSRPDDSDQRRHLSSWGRRGKGSIRAASIGT